MRRQGHYLVVPKTESGKRFMTTDDFLTGELNRLEESATRKRAVCR